MKTVILVGLLCIGIAFAQNCYPPKCVADSDCANTPNSACVKSFNTTNTGDVGSCSCTIGYKGDCKSLSSLSNSTFVCVLVSTNNTACGADWPNGCPDSMYCYTDSVSADLKKCICKDSTQYYDSTLRTCRIRCLQYSVYNLDQRKCVCETGYVPDSTQGTSDQPYCVPSNLNVTKCADGFTCSNCTKCVDSDKGAYCASLATCATCGVDFQCSLDGNWECQQTPSGPTCLCKRGWGGIGCKSPTCQPDNTGALTCSFFSEHAICFADRTSSTPYCICSTGYFGDQCQYNSNTTINPCKEVVCKGTNTQCVDGKCVCQFGYVPSRPLDSTYTDLNCVPSCDLSCTGNYVCALVETTPKCVCPFTIYGSYDCSKPRCSTDADCGDDAYCVTSTKSDVPPYCSCKYGFSGGNCSEITDCDATKCSGNFVCSNDGRCVCGPMYIGDACDIKKNSSACKVFELFLKFGANARTLTAEEVQIVIIALAGVDAASLTVEGPVDTTDQMVKKYVVTFCSNDNVDGTKAVEQLASSLNSGFTGGLPVTEEPVVATTGDMGNSGAVAGASVILASALVALVL